VPGHNLNLPEKISQRIGEWVAGVQELSRQAGEIAPVAEALIKTYQAGNKAIFFGNGGSAADAQHLAAEMVGRFLKERDALPALALTVNTSILTAVGNDYGYEQVFVRQLEALGKAGDVAVAISTSGNSPNISSAVLAAKQRGLVTVGLTGRGGGRLKAEVDHCICVPADTSPRIQEMHILIGHILCELIEAALFPGGGVGE
jgi:D-sedoheptulose 7-phosphate isomerase